MNNDWDVAYMSYDLRMLHGPSGSERPNTAENAYEQQ